MVGAVRAVRRHPSQFDAAGAEARHFDFAENINLKVVDHIDGGRAIRQLTFDVVLHECLRADSTLLAVPDRHDYLASRGG